MDGSRLPVLLLPPDMMSPRRQSDQLKKLSPDIDRAGSHFFAVHFNGGKKTVPVGKQDLHSLPLRRDSRTADFV